jgi:hypothetical protein
LSRTKSAALEIDSAAPAWSWKTLVETHRSALAPLAEAAVEWNQFDV